MTSRYEETNKRRHLGQQTWICLRALSHSFWPGADWVQMLNRWLMDSVTALRIKCSKSMIMVHLNALNTLGCSFVLFCFCFFICLIVVSAVFCLFIYFVIFGVFFFFLAIGGFFFLLKSRVHLFNSGTICILQVFSIDCKFISKTVFFTQKKILSEQ